MIALSKSPWVLAATHINNGLEVSDVVLLRGDQLLKHKHPGLQRGVGSALGSVHWDLGGAIGGVPRWLPLMREGEGG